MDTLLSDNISECALYLERKTGQTCMPEKAAKAVAEAAKDSGCKTERCRVEYLGRKKDVETYFKIAGPNNVQLLSNNNIDETLQQWAKKFPDFYPCNFNMRNYASYSFRDGRVLSTPDTLATLKMDELFAAGTRTFGCVINSGLYQSNGVHWMALFVDMRSKGIATIEFFNSSGNAPAPEWINWMVKTKNALDGHDGHDGIGLTATIERVSNRPHQRSKTECGVYSLFYIWARLNGVSLEVFRRGRIPDEKMFEFRQHLFYDKSAPYTAPVFDADLYMKLVKTTWEQK